MAPPQQSERKRSTTGSVFTGMTMTKRIFSRASEKSHLSPGENVWVNIDVLMTHDVRGPGCIGIFKTEFGNDAKVWDLGKVVIIPDHYIFTSDERANSNFNANPDYKGICHVALALEGHCRPGEVLLGTDSHTCTTGAFGLFATGIGNTDPGFVLGTGKLLLKGPPTLRFVLDRIHRQRGKRSSEFRGKGRRNTSWYIQLWSRRGVMLSAVNGVQF